MRKESVNPITFSVIKARVDGIIDEMSQVLLRTSRNPILYAAKDFTCGMFSHDAKLLTMMNSIPVHIIGLRNCLKSVVELFGEDIHPGDCFVNNSPYHGANHMGDWSMFAPVFYEDKLIAWSANTCHLIDTGAYIPANMDPFAKDVYEEGLHFPPMRFVKDYKETPDIIRFIKANFRYPDQWHGDFLSQVGSLRIGERGMVSLCKKYGIKVVKEFQDELIDYGDRRMTEEIRKLPKGTWSIEDRFEKIDKLAPEGVRLAASMSIDPDESVITFDLTKMGDQLPWGYNCSRSTAEGTCILSTLTCLDPTLPRNDGVYKHFRIHLKEGAICGIPKWPVGTSIGTVGPTDVVTGMLYRLWEKVEPGRGHAAGGEVNAAAGITSGTDPRKNQEPYGHFYFVAMSGGPASKGCDGWPVWLHNACMGNQALESIELLELVTPVIVWEAGVVADSAGAGEWRGAVGLYHRIQPRNHTMKLITFATGHNHPPKGVAGSMDGKLGDHWLEKHSTREKVKQLRNADNTSVGPDEDWVAICSGGGGYGDPLDRDPEAVREDARNYFVSIEAARNKYGVLLKIDTELFSVDYKATKKLREELRKARGMTG